MRAIAQAEERYLVAHERAAAAQRAFIARVEAFIRNQQASPRILVVEDVEVLARATARSLRHYDVTIAGTGEAALEALRTRAFDLAIVDLHLPGIDGLELVQTLRRASQRPLLPVIAVSGAVDEARGREAAALAGANVYLQKPYSMAGLLENVERLLPSRAGSGYGHH